MHGVLWERMDDVSDDLPEDEPLTLASYVAGSLPDAYIEHLGFDMPLVEMPLFLNPERYVSVPLDSTFMAAFRGMPAIWREALA